VAQVPKPKSTLGEKIERKKVGGGSEDLYKGFSGRETTFGQAHLETLSLMLNLGIIYRDQGQLAESEKILRKLNGGCQKSTYPLFPLVSNALGTLHSLLNNYEKAAKEYDLATKSLSNGQEEDDFLIQAATGCSIPARLISICAAEARSSGLILAIS
jgi:tetratricopeptide (TPR) repeat protein